MADTETKLEALEQEAVAETSTENTQVEEAAGADAPKKNAVAAEPTHLKNDAEDLGPAVVKPTDSNPDATKKTKQVSGDAQQKSQGAADPMPKLSGHNTKLESAEAEASEEDKTVVEGEMPAGLKKYLDKKADKEESKDAEAKDEKSEKKHMKASYNKEEIDVTADVDALIAGEGDLSEEFKNKAATIFEAAIKSKVTKIAEEIEADYNNKFEAEVKTAKDELVEKVDSYLNYVVEEWMKENELALERGIKGEIAEDFISGLKKLFEDHYIDVPDEKYNVLEDQAQKIEDLEKKLNEEVEKNVKTVKENASYQAKEIIAEAGADLADTAKEKFAELTKEIDYSNADEFKAKVNTIKENYFGVKSDAKEELDDVAAGSSEDNLDLSNAMAAYTAAISKTKDIKLSK